MARNRTEQDRGAKRAEIVSAASRLFTEQGYESTSITAIASAAGITTNTIYWYFADKDALLVSVLEQMVAEAQEEFAAAPPADLTASLLWLVDMIGRIERLMVTVHARAPISPTVQAWHEQFHAIGDAVILQAIREHLAASGSAVPSDDVLRPVPRIWSYAIEGMVAHDLPADERRTLCDTLVAQLRAL